MKNILLALLTVALATSCNSKPNNYNKITITPNDTLKEVMVEISYTDTLLMELPVAVPDSIILKSVQAMSDSLKRDSIRRDSLQKLNFRRITRIINGGYNGYADREAIWIKAKEIIK